MMSAYRWRRNDRGAGVKITIGKSQTADTRTCDWSKVTREQLLRSSIQHKGDIAQALGLFQLMLTEASTRHDFDKLSAIGHFHADFATGFKETGWWDNHRKVNRHHLTESDGIPEDVNLIDVLDHIADCVMSGLARSGSVYELHLPDEMLQRAFQNTVTLLKSSVEVAE
jgi:hypothetical protein